MYFCLGLAAEICVPSVIVSFLIVLEGVEVNELVASQEFQCKNGNTTIRQIYKFTIFCLFYIPDISRNGIIRKKENKVTIVATSVNQEKISYKLFIPKMIENS